VFALKSSLISRAKGAALAATVGVMTVLAALASDARQPASAQGRLEAEYLVTIAGLPIGHGNWVVEISDNAYTAAASGATAGLLKFITGAQGTGAARGIISDGRPVPTSYAATIIDSRHVDQVRIALDGGNVTDFTAEPPLIPLPDRIPVTDADRRGVVDPMTSALTRVGGSGDPVNPQACDRKIAVFDGRVRYDLHSEYKRMETVKAERGYEGPAVVCSLYFTPISGFVPSRATIRYLVELRDAEVWLAPIAGTRVLVPFRFAMPTPLGLGVLEARQFVSVAQPSRAVAKTQ
jgi:Protein of unknown function (DUF3108)